MNILLCTVFQREFETFFRLRFGISRSERTFYVPTEQEWEQDKTEKEEYDKLHPENDFEDYLRLRGIL